MPTKTYYQYYTNVTYRTCPECLSWHGRIDEDETGFPDRHDGCERRLLPFGAKELRSFREREKEMRAAAGAELDRRALLSEAMAALGSDDESALSLLSQAAAVDLHVAEIEALCAAKRDVLQTDAALRERVRTLSVRAYSDKFGHPRYERLPEVMRLERERDGIAKINDLLR